MQIVMELPNKETPGFLRRSRQALEFSKRLKSKEIETKVLDDMVEFLLPFIKEPEDRVVARESLWDASQAQFEKVMEALAGSAEETVPPPNAES